MILCLKHQQEEAKIMEKFRFFLLRSFVLSKKLAEVGKGKAEKNLFLYTFFTQLHDMKKSTENS
jgi:hypothetical protein